MAIGDVSHLPFSRAEAERIRMSISRGADWSTAELGRTDEGYLRQLTGRPILKWPPELPPHDPRGVSSAPSFECWKKASASKIGIAGSYFSHKAGGRTACHSFLEAKLLRSFEMNPYVIEIRTQYPSWDRDAFLAYALRGRRMPKNKVLTIDFMLTLHIPGYPFRLYLGVSGKPSALLQEPAVLGRHERETSQLWTWGCAHEVMTERTVTEREHVNCRRLLSYMLHTDDIGALVPAVVEFAQAISTTTASGPLKRVIGMVAKRLGHDERMGFRLFGLAHFLGYLRWNHRYELDPRKPLSLSD
ncbi:hypothetical protein AWB76_07233 [Caballeronia temeraria]|uniref:Transposon Tn7 transposition protein TnsA n=1 Tax=Caballeronia temeraria TaxID=1777137 RepID=A0A158DPB7_9BURK|nr:hypothetical protein AWB76_07233 [Caballeronia temeraria]